MTNEQIIIDGKGCRYKTWDKDCALTGDNHGDNMKPCKFIDEKNCYYKQLQRSESRVKELEEKLNAQFAEMEEKLTAEENKNFELKENIKTIFTSLIIANHVDIGAILDTIWVDNYTTLWDYIRIILNMDDKQFEEFEKQALKQMEEVK